MLPGALLIIHCHTLRLKHDPRLDNIFNFKPWPSRYVSKGSVSHLVHLKTREGCGAGLSATLSLGDASLWCSGLRH